MTCTIFTSSQQGHSTENYLDDKAKQLIKDKRKQIKEQLREEFNRKLDGMFAECNSGIEFISLAGANPLEQPGDSSSPLPSPYDKDFFEGEIDRRLGRIIYYTLSKIPDFYIAAKLLESFKRDLKNNRYHPNDNRLQRLIMSATFLVNLIEKLHKLKHRMDAETDDNKKWQLQNRYSSKQKTLFQEATPVAQGLLDMERKGYMQDIEREAYRRFPDNEEERINYFNSF